MPWHASGSPINSRSPLDNFQTTVILPPDLPLSFLDINLVSKHNEGEILGIMGTGLDQELISPTIESFERLGAVHVVYEYTAVCTTVEGDTERLETLLTRSIPQLALFVSGGRRATKHAYLHRHKTVIDHNLLRKAIDGVCLRVRPG